METLFIHVAKSTALALLFLVCYLIFLRRETYFASNRLYLLAGLLVSLFLPFVQFTKTVWIEAKPLVYGSFQVVASTPFAEPKPFDWMGLFTTLYLVVMTFFIARFALQLWSIKALKQKSEVVHEGDIKHIRSKKELSPFSFFKNIFYCPTQFEPEDLKVIIAHEKAHARQHHSFDMLFMELTCAVLWFNPLLWIYKYYVKQNLEFLADSVALDQVSDKKQYQYLMLRQAIGPDKFAIASPFFNSLTKKRITMLHQNQSKKMNLIKLLVVLPFLVLFLVAFSTKTEYKTLHVENSLFIKKDKSFEYVIQKTTSNEQMEQIKKELKANDVDFSYTSVRATNGEIIDLQINVTGFDVTGQYFNLDYASDSGKPIEDILIYHNQAKKEFFIGEKDKKEAALKNIQVKPNYIQSPNKTAPKKNVDFSARITSITIEVNKNSTDADLKKDSKFLADNHNLKVEFKGIRRNSADEITAIKVNYDNGEGDKGNYEQERTDTIEPFKVVVTFSKDSPADIRVLTDEQQGNFFVFDSLDEIGEHDDIIIKRGLSHKNVWVSADDKETTQVIELKKDGDDEVIILNGKVISQDSLAKHGKLEENFTKVMRVKNDDGAITEIIEVKVKEADGKSKTIKLLPDESDDTSKKYLIIETDSIHSEEGDSEYRKITIDVNDSGDYDNDVKIVSKSGKRPLYVMDGKIVKKMKPKKMDTDNIESINVLKGKAAIEKYGEKGKNGAVEIITKKGN